MRGCKSAQIGIPHQGSFCYGQPTDSIGSVNAMMHSRFLICVTVSQISSAIISLTTDDLTSHNIYWKALPEDWRF